MGNSSLIRNWWHRLLTIALTIAVAVLSVKATHTPATPHLMASGPLPPPGPNQYWNQATWYIDPANSVSGACASDINTCAQNTCGAAGSNQGPCLTWNGVVSKWGTKSPTLNQNTTITFMSSHSNNTDPVELDMVIGADSLVHVLGTLTTVVSSTMTSVTNRSQTFTSPNLFNATFGGGAQDDLFVGTDGANTGHGWIYTNVSGTTWNVSQTVIAVSAPFSTLTVASPVVTNEVKTWTNGDSFTISTVSNVNITRIAPTMTQAHSGSQMNGLFVEDLAVFDPTGTLNYGSTTVTIDDSASTIVMQDVQFQRHVALTNAMGNEVIPFRCVNCDFIGGAHMSGIAMSSIANQPAPYHAPSLTAGIIHETNTSTSTHSNYVLRGVYLNQDILVDDFLESEVVGFWSCVFVDNAQLWQINGAMIDVLHSNCGPSSTALVWGKGKVAIIEQASMIYASITTATASFLVNGGGTATGVGAILLNGLSIAPDGARNTTTAGALPDFYNGPITFANIDGTNGFTTLTGGSTFNVTATSGTVTATGSAFTTQLVVGRSVTFSAQTGVMYTVSAIASDTSMTITPVYNGTTSTTSSAQAIGFGGGVWSPGGGYVGTGP